MSGMLADLCSHYYKLTEKVEKRDERYKKLVETDPTFNMNATVRELDEIIDHKLKIDKAYEYYQVAFEKWKETEKKILTILKHFGIRPRWTLTGQVPGEVVYWVWYDLNDNVHIMKVEDFQLATDELDPNTMYIPLPDMEAIADEDEFEKEEREQREAERNRRYEIHNRSVSGVKQEIAEGDDDLDEDEE